MYPNFVLLSRIQFSIWGSYTIQNMVKRWKTRKFHAKEFLKREAINVFTEIWVFPFTAKICSLWNLHLLKSASFYKLRQILSHVFWAVKIPPYTQSDRNILSLTKGTISNASLYLIKPIKMIQIKNGPFKCRELMFPLITDSFILHLIFSLSWC